MVETLKSLAKSLPYPVFLRLFYGWDRVRSWPRAEIARRRVGVPLLDEVDLLQVKASDTLFVLGSGPSINRISAQRWNSIAAHDAVGFNWWLYHSFVPKFYFFEVIEKDESNAFDAYLSLADRRAADYSSTIKVAMEFHKPEMHTLDYLPPAFKSNLFAAHKTEAPARNEAELAWALRYLQDRRAFEVSGRFRSLLKYAASLTTMLVFGLRLGYKRIVLCGIDLKTADNFYQDLRFYAESWRPTVIENRGSHNTDVPLTWRVPVTRAVAVFKEQLLDPAGVELYVETKDSALWPILPVFPASGSGIPRLSKTSGLPTAGIRLLQ